MMAARRIGFTLLKLEQSKLHRLRRRRLRNKDYGLGTPDSGLRTTDYGLRPQPCPAPDVEVSIHTLDGV